MRLVECVPNFSEGRDRDKIQSIVREMKDRLIDWLITAGETDQIAPRWLL